MRPLLAGDVDVEGAPESADSPALLLDALYSVCSQLASCGPLVLAIDDAQWGDVESLRFCEYLARRVERRPILLCLAARSHEPSRAPEPLVRVRADDRVTVLTLAPLSEGASRELVRRGLGVDPDPGFAHACHEATGGNPFLLCELVRTLAGERIEPTASAAARVARIGPQAVFTAVLLRLRGLDADAPALAHAIAVMESAADLSTVAKVAGVAPERAGQLVDQLTAANVLAAGRPLTFAHPIVREAIYSDIGPETRAAWHARAARALIDAGAALEQSAAQLLLATRCGEPSTVALLSDAAAAAHRKGAPAAAAVYLRRALAEPPRADTRREVLSALSARRRGAREPRSAGDRAPGGRARAQYRARRTRQHP
jgi:predicted ATPase